MRAGENLFGAWMVLIGVVAAVLLGIFQYNFSSYNLWVYIILVILGVIIGFFSVRTDSQQQATVFLLATVSLVIVSSMGQERLIVIREIGIPLITILNALLTMFIPATIIVAVKTLFSVASVS